MQSSYNKLVDTITDIINSKIKIAEQYPEVRLDYTDGLQDGLNIALDLLKLAKPYCDFYDLAHDDQIK